MLEGRIDLENELLDVLARRYEKERDELLEVAGLKRETLSEELELLDEQLEARRKLNEEEDRAGKLEELEEQLERISADPTRKKEELALREEIAELRRGDRMGPGRIGSGRAEEVHRIADRVRGRLHGVCGKLLRGTALQPPQADRGDPGPADQNGQRDPGMAGTEPRGLPDRHGRHREEMRLGWQEMLDDMRGNTQTYWDEVEQIIAQGDEAIIEFLKANSADYKEAGKLQAEAYVDEWTKKLEDLKNAYKKVSDEIKSYSYTPTSSSKSSGSGGGSSSGSRSSGSSSKSTPRFVASGTGYAEAYRGKITSVSYNGETYIKGHNSNYWYKQSDAQRIDGGRTYYWKTGTTKYVKKYLEGGLADAAGLAWLDGTKQRPERILSPYQTELFEDMVRSLHAIRTLRAPASVVTPALPEARQAQGVNIENITVQVQRLESEQDYEEMAERVGEEIMEKITRGMAVGGVRIG